MFKRLILALAAIVGGLVLVAGGCLWWGIARPLPSDAHLRSQFQEHRSDFDRLAAMARADTDLVGAGHDPMLMRYTVYVHTSSTHSRRLTDDELRSPGPLELRRLLDRVGLPSISRSREESLVWFVVVSSGGARKGFVYSEKPLEPVLASLDGRRESGYVSLAPRWYLFRQPSD